jgi:O-6-methylguanine DNA methyltransferase
MHHIFHHDGREAMIEVYVQNSSDTWFAVAFTQQQIITSSFSPAKELAIKNVLSNIPFNLPFQVFHEPSAPAKNALSVLKSIFNGEEVNINLPLATAHLPTYTKKVLKATQKIPVGYVTSYGAIAQTVGGGPRAVGNIMAGNPFAPIVPCHRVVKSDFRLGGYGFGLKVKIELLRRERRGFSSAKEMQVAGGLLEVFPVEYVLRNLA